MSIQLVSGVPPQADSGVSSMTHIRVAMNAMGVDDLTPDTRNLKPLSLKRIT